MSIADANVALAWAVPSVHSDAAVTLLATPGRIIAPDLIVHEVANAIWLMFRQGLLEAGDAPRALEDALAPVSTFVPGRALAIRALEIATALGHPAYDCFYLAAAEREDDCLVTADARLVQATIGTEFEDRIRSLAG